MPNPGPPRLRRARPADAAAIAALHADSWQRHYRGAFADAFLDGDVEADRAAVWTERFGAMSDREHTHVAEVRGVVDQSPGSGLHLWVLEQNTRAQAFYGALGGERVERDKVAPPAGDAGRLNGSPMRLRYAWPEPGELGRG